MISSKQIAALLTGTLLSVAALAADPPAAHHGMMGADAGNAGPMMMHGCSQNDSNCMTRMTEHRQRLNQMHVVAQELKIAKTDKQRIDLLQRYVGLMDAQMGQMMEMMDQRANTPTMPDDHGHP